MMIAILSLVTSYAGWRACNAVRQVLRALPRRNDDMVFF
jgi:hypothetical protein